MYNISLAYFWHLGQMVSSDQIYVCGFSLIACGELQTGHPSYFLATPPLRPDLWRTQPEIVLSAAAVVFCRVIMDVLAASLIDGLLF